MSESDPTPKKRGRPPGARNKPRVPQMKTRQKVTTYEEMGKYLKAFADGHINLLVLIGSWGVGKSQMLHKLVNGSGCWLEGNVTAFGMYSKLYEGRDKRVVIDDVDGLYADRKCVSLLKSLCQSDDEKTIRWDADSKYLERRNLPPQFQTKSHVAIVANDWRNLNRNVKALEDRGHVIDFEPSAKEVHIQAGEWFKDKDEEIYEWFGNNLHRVVVPSFRSYLRAQELKKAGIVWKTILGETRFDIREMLVKELMEDEKFASHEERMIEFAKRGGGSRGTFMNYRKKLGL